MGRGSTTTTTATSTSGLQEGPAQWQGDGIFRQRIKVRREFQNGFKNGKGVEYFENGDVFRGEYKNGIKDGDCIMFYANGDWEVGKVKGNSWLNTTTSTMPTGHGGEQVPEQSAGRLMIHRISFMINYIS